VTCVSSVVIFAVNHYQPNPLKLVDIKSDMF
jgi:hypothetical protein